MLEALRFRRSGKTRREEKETESTLDMSTLSFTGRTANWSARHRWWVVAASVMVLVLAMFVMSSVEPKMYDGDGGAGDSSIAAKLVDEKFDFESPPLSEQLVFSNPSLNANTPEFRSTVEGLVQKLKALPEVESVVSFYDTEAQGMVSDDGHVVLAQVMIDSSEKSARDQVGAILDMVRAANAENDSFEIGIAGAISISEELDEIAEAGLARMFLVTIILGLGILLIAFRSAVGAVVPLVLAIGSVFTANAVAVLVSGVYPLAEGYMEMILLMGMAVGIDYSLFIASRFRSERKAGRPKLEAIAVASNTTGRAVFYAGITVVLSLGGLALTSNPIFISYALGAIIVVLIALIGSLTLLPAMLSVLGDKINWLRLPIIGRDRPEGKGGFWGAITNQVQARPAIFAAVTTIVLIAMAAPILSLNMGFNSGSHALPNELEGKRAVELLEEHFTAGLATPAFVVVDAADVNAPEVQTSVASLMDAVGQEDAFFPPFEVQKNKAGDLLFVMVPLAGEIDAEESQDAVRLLRNEIIPTAFKNSGANVYVGGETAGSMDFKDQIVSTTPYVFAFVLGLAFLLLLVMFRSIVIPIKAIILNLLSVGAAYGVLVMIFQWGWGISLVGAEATGIIESWLPLFLFGILFGLSMDYHMLVLNRIKEAYDAGHSNKESVSIGINITAGQITSAAAIMIGVFGAFALIPMVAMKQFGIGLAVAVLIDATVIRTVLLPASMQLLGDRNWYLPSWLEWLPKIGSEEGESQGDTLPAPQPEYGNQAIPQMMQGSMDD